MGWQPGDPIVRREIVRGKPWLGAVVRVVVDEAGALVTYIPEGTPFGLPAGDWPTPNGRHPWHGRDAWTGHGVLMMQRPGESYAVWHFWDEPERRFAGWYLNLQRPFTRTGLGYDTQDLELDVWIPADDGGGWVFKDDDKLEERVHEGRFTQEEVAKIRAEGARIGAMLEHGERWWNGRWSSWAPPRDWTAQPLPEGWDVV